MKIKIENKKIGDNEPCFVIAEIGSNHNQEKSLAFELIDAAAESNVDAVKFQTFKSSEHYSSKTPGFSYLNNINTSDLIKSLELNRSWQKELMDYAEKRNLIFFSSPCDIDAVDGLAKIDVPLYKVASFDITDDSLIKYISKQGKPVILSTGMASLNEIQIAIDSAKSVDNNEIVLLQCTSLYPAPAYLSNLNSISTMKKAFNTLVGYSDHTKGDHVAIAAVTLGACVIEKHFTLDRKLPGPDHPFAIEPKELNQMMIKIREVESSFGDGLKNGPRIEEREMAEKGKRSVHAKVKIPLGKKISDEMLCIKRPGLGIHPSLRNQIIGRTARKSIDKDEWITWEKI